MFRLCAAVLLVLVAAAGLTRWIKASDHKDSALLAADHAADIADVYTLRSPVHPDNVDLVIQAFVTVTGGHQVMHFRGPAPASQTGATSRVLEGPEMTTVRVSNGETPMVAS